jgi:hypothetical protein
MDEKKKSLDKFKFLKHKSDKSIEKVADSFMDFSSKIYITITLSIFVVPLASIMKLVISENPASLNIETIIKNMNAMFLIFVFFIIVGFVYAHIFRNWAMYLYDYLEEKQNKKANNAFTLRRGVKHPYIGVKKK